MPSSPLPPANPFNHRGVIRREEDFVGRIRTDNSVSVVGERCIGKPSLL